MEFIEIILVILFLAILIGVGFIKRRLSDMKKLVISLLTGVPLIIWSWLYVDAHFAPKLLITVTVLGALLKYAWPAGAAKRNAPS
jgi:hypothetical protein